MNELIQKIKNRKKSKNIVLVEGLNILKHKNGINDYRNINLVRIWGKENGVTPIFILPGFKKYRKLCETNDDIFLLDPRIYDDIAILAYARELDFAILSNDKFREFRKMFKDLDFRKVFPYAIRNGNFLTRAADHFFFRDPDYYTNSSNLSTFKSSINNS